MLAIFNEDFRGAQGIDLAIVDGDLIVLEGSEGEVGFLLVSLLEEVTDFLV